MGHLTRCERENDDPMSFFQQLKKRNVLKVGGAYLVAGWLLLQVADVIINNIGAPAWVFKALLTAVGLGLPLVLVFSWVFEMTPEGLKKERDVEPSTSITSQTGRKLNHLTIALLVIAVAYLGAEKFIFQGTEAEISVAPESTDAGPITESIAVLPFVNMSSDPEQEFFSDGITEELLNMLAKIPDFRVAGRTSSFAFKGQNIDLRDVGERLGVANILEGSVRKGGGRVRITAQLIKVENGFHLWSETYDRELTDILAVQDEISQAVVSALQLQLLGDSYEQMSDPIFSQTAAHNAYLGGLYQINIGTPESYAIASDLMEQAVSLAPASATAWASLAGAALWEAGTTNDDPAPVLARAREALSRSMELNPELSKAFLQKGALAMGWDWDWKTAEQAFRRSLELSPGSVEAQANLANLMFMVGRREEAFELLSMGRRLDPLNASIQLELVRLQLGTGQIDEAVDQLETMLAARERTRLRFYLGEAYYLSGDYERALQQMQAETTRFLQLVGLAICHHKIGQVDEARAAQEAMWDEYQELASYQQAQVFAQWGLSEEAIDWLWRAYEVRDPGIRFLNTDPLLQPLVGHRRFEELRSTLKLPQVALGP